MPFRAAALTWLVFRCDCQTHAFCMFTQLDACLYKWACIYCTAVSNLDRKISIIASYFQALLTAARNGQKGSPAMKVDRGTGREEEKYSIHIETTLVCDILLPFCDFIKIYGLLIPFVETFQKQMQGFHNTGKVASLKGRPNED